MTLPEIVKVLTFQKIGNGRINVKLENVFNHHIEVLVQSTSDGPTVCFVAISSPFTLYTWFTAEQARAAAQALLQAADSCDNELQCSDEPSKDT